MSQLETTTAEFEPVQLLHLQLIDAAIVCAFCIVCKLLRPPSLLGFHSAHAPVTDQSAVLAPRPPAHQLQPSIVL